MTLSVLVVGGAGYIGSHMCHALADAGMRVTVLDNLSRGHADAVAGFTLLEADIRSEADVRRCLSIERFDLVMHFAALAYVGESVSDPRPYYENNVAGTLCLLRGMLEAGLRRMVFSSTCATYGAPVALPMDEAHPQVPVNPYGWTKLSAEQALRDYAVAYGLESISLRYFNAAGCDPDGRATERHEPETHLLPLILREAARLQAGGDPEETALVVFGDDFPTPDGTCIRDYVHVSDLCRAHLLAGRRLLAGQVDGAEAYNLGNGQGYSILQAIASARRVTGQDIRYRVAPRRAGDPAALIGDGALARRVLDWEPEWTGLDEILSTVWARMKCDGLGVSR
ncbi:UDP-glucose 4-epimerase GalE [Luteimonas vadosa]|uniref:UDP-glucose 4-epimerase n=1 Tax=Luteimonas vadosa TaxID=1165507 RepID=A0ABP9DQB2_9GAMM